MLGTKTTTAGDADGTSCSQEIYEVYEVQLVSSQN